MKYVDLFAGCGGLSLGMERAGGQLVVAVEKSSMAARTFYHNHFGSVSNDKEWAEYLSSDIRHQFESGVIISELREVLNNSSLMSQIAAENIDAVVGGPPCQGFSLAGRRNPQDIRNALPYEFLEFVAKTMPKVVVIENVVGMNRRFDTRESESPFEQLQQALREVGDGYLVQGLALNAMHFGAAQHRPRLMIFGVRLDIARDLGLRATKELWSSTFADQLRQPFDSDLLPQATTRSDAIRTVADAIADLQTATVRRLEHDGSGYLKEIGLLSDWGIGVDRRQGATPKNHVLRKHSERTRQRFRLYQWIRDTGISPQILSSQANPALEAALSAVMEGYTYPVVAPDLTELASDWEAMRGLLDRLRTKKHSQKALHWYRPARTVVTLPDDYVHPSEPRVFTVRELARFQGFPDDFEFQDKVTTGSHRRKAEVPQYSQVGNAVSPMMALAVARVASRINLASRAQMTQELKSLQVISA